MLTYCMNVHPGETLDDQIHNIEAHAVPIAQGFRAKCPHTSPDTPFGLGLRFGAPATRAFLASPAAQEQIQALCTQHHLVPFTLNAFPYGPFHQTAVKATVYHPTWCHPERPLYTAQAARTLARLMPPDITKGSLSTAPLSFKAFHEDLTPAYQHVIQALQDLYVLHQETGKCIQLALEPEPGCYPETTPETIEVIQKITQLADPALTPYLGVCFDTAHLLVEFEDLTQSVACFTQAGIPISKCQISAALAAPNTRAAHEALAPFAEGTYLHQTCIQHPNGTLEAFLDLPEALEKAPLDPNATLRTHFHVPLFEAGSPPLSSTTHLLQNPSLFHALARNGCSHFEVETYTWNVWQDCTQNPIDLHEGIIQELLTATHLLSLPR